MTIVHLSEQAGRRPVEPADLGDRIAAAIATVVKSDFVAALITEADAAAAAAAETAERARERALDPTLTSADVTSARRTAEDAAFTRDRLKTAVTRLASRLKEVKSQEEDQRRRVVYEKAKAERDRLAAELRSTYPAIEAQLGKLIAAIAENDRQLDYVNTELPKGAERLKSAELLARGIGAWRIDLADVVRISRELCLPRFQHDAHSPYVWPVNSSRLY
jgi:DNA repair exonuclease SbcCD ATPase subunit